MRRSGCFLMLMITRMCVSAIDPSFYKPDDRTTYYKNNAADTLHLTSPESLSITVSLGSGDQVTFTPQDLLEIKSSVISVVSYPLIKGNNDFDVNLSFSKLILSGTCSPSDNPVCTATITPFNFTATLNDDYHPDPPTYESGKIEMPDSIEVEVSITLNAELADQEDTAESKIAQQIKEAITENGRPGALLAAIQTVIGKSYVITDYGYYNGE